MRTALFHNFTKEEFIGYWNGKSRTFKPGEKKFMPEYLARHFAKHLSNKVLTAAGKDSACSPKKPEEVPLFMAEFNKAFQLQAGDDNDDDLDVAIDLANKPKDEATSSLPEKPKKSLGTELKTKVDPDEDDEYEGGSEKEEN